MEGAAPASDIGAVTTHPRTAPQAIAVPAGAVSSIAELPYVVAVGRQNLSEALPTIAASEAPAHRYAFIVDSTVAALHRDHLMASDGFVQFFSSDRCKWLTVPPGEREKTREQWARLTDALIEWGAGRDTTIIAIGGGVVCDLAGFVAATFMRGVPVIQVPTTLLAMVDASVGGKTGVDTVAGKNLVGAFHNPSAVIADVEMLGTLPAPIFRSGLAEMLKHGVLADENYFDAIVEALPELASDDGARCSALPELVRRSIEIKAAVVAEDHREQGRRHTLNFGHTIAHAIEQQAGYDMLHGDAVAIGMIVEAEIAERVRVAEKGTAERVMRGVALARLPMQVPHGISLQQIVLATQGDKKARLGQARYALPRSVGRMEPADGRWALPVPDDVVLAALAAHQG